VNNRNQRRRGDKEGQLNPYSIFIWEEKKGKAGKGGVKGVVKIIGREKKGATYETVVRAARENKSLPQRGHRTYAESEQKREMFGGMKSGILWTDIERVESIRIHKRRSV